MRRCGTPLTVRWDDALLDADEGAYRMISDGDLSKYLKRAVRRFRYLQESRALACRAADGDGRFERYTREMHRCNQIICRIRRERKRRIAAGTGSGENV